MAAGRLPTTDSGTVILHAIFVLSFAALAVTGLRIASDDPAASWLTVLDPVLPMEHIWFRHLIAALIFTTTLVGYIVYMIKARLTARTRLDSARLAALKRPGKPRWAAMTAVISWGLMAGLITELVTGTALFAGADRTILVVHLWANWACLLLVVLHVVCHGIVGGLAQLTRVVRPAALVMAPKPPDLAELLAEQLQLREQNLSAPDSQPTTPSRQSHRPGGALHAHPAATALAVALLFGAGALGLETSTRPILHVVDIRQQQAPRLDGDLSDPVWMQTTPVSVLTTQGWGFGGTGQSLVEVRGVHDGTFAYFAFVWSDPTRSLKHQPLIKTPTGWQVARDTTADAADGLFLEDKFSVLLAASSLPLIGAAIHLSPAPLKDRPASASGRGLHYTTDGSIADVWIWRASHGGLNGHIDNGHFGPPVEPPREATDNAAAYTGGFGLDPGPVAYRANRVRRPMSPAPNGAPGHTAIEPLRLPRDAAAVTLALGDINTASSLSDSDGARWWMTQFDTVAYSKATDEKIPVGTVIPGIIMANPDDGGRQSIRGVARWAAGRWTLEVARRLYTGSANDVAIKTGTLMWVAAFDHSENRHTRHLRPLKLEVD